MQTKRYIFACFMMIISIATLGTLYVSNYESSLVIRSQSSSALSQNDRSTFLGETQKASPSLTQKESEVIFNDPSINQNWGLRKSDAKRAWEISQGSRNIVVAVIDTGIDVNHEDLRKNLWINQAEIPNNGIDDDKNGYVDDVYGWNFVSNNNNLTDNHGHGTHIAGIVGAEAGNGKGIAGVAPKVSLMILKYYDPKVPHTDNLRNTIRAIEYAVKMNAHIINYSGGGLEFSQDEFEAIKKAEEKGILFVAAAGNERTNSDKNKYYPADYDLENIISVTAINPHTEVLQSSNWGVETVDIAAPGENILSTFPNNSYGYLTGTSQATSFVTGGAVIVMAHNPHFQAQDVKKYLLKTGDAIPQLISKCRTSRKLNLYRSLTMLDSDVAVNGVVIRGPALRGTPFQNDPQLPHKNTNELNSFNQNISDIVVEMNKQGMN